MTNMNDSHYCMYGSQAVWSAAPHATSHAQRKPQNATISHFTEYLKFLNTVAMVRKTAERYNMISQFTEYLKSLNNGCHHQEKKSQARGKVKKF